MNRLVNLILVVCTSVLAGIHVSAKTPVLLHSHNDYDRDVPFYEAYSNGVASVEADIFYVDGELFVGHDPEDVNEGRKWESTL